MIIHGPHVIGFEETYQHFDAANGAVRIDHVDSLAIEVLTYSSADKRQKVVKAAQGVVSEHRAVLDKTWSQIASYLTHTK